MGQVLIRNIDDDVLADWREIAAANGRSLESELRDVLRRAKPVAPSKIAQLQADFAAIRAMTPKRLETPSEDILRKYRDGDGEDGV